MIDSILGKGASVAVHFWRIVAAMDSWAAKLLKQCVLSLFHKSASSHSGNVSAVSACIYSARVAPGIGNGTAMVLDDRDAQHRIFIAVPAGDGSARFDVSLEPWWARVGNGMKLVLDDGDASHQGKIMTDLPRTGARNDVS